jgi:hypothetical protein
MNVAVIGASAKPERYSDQAAGITTLEACTLVLLKTGAFES